MAKAYATLGKLIKDSRTMIEEMGLESDHPGITDAVEGCSTPGQVKKMMDPYKELFSYVKKSKRAAGDLGYDLIRPTIMEDLATCRSQSAVDQLMRGCRIQL